MLGSKPQYGNWVSKRLIYIFGLLFVIFGLSGFFLYLMFIPAVVCLIIAGYFQYARYLLSPSGKNVQDQIWQTAIDNLDWNGQGKALDIGCGNGALTIKLAKTFPNAKVTGIDFWGERWEYSKSTCEDNALTEGVSDRVEFRKASASKLPFGDAFFDAAVSNLCFHEVADTKDKRQIIAEALRVVRKGGSFAFQDLFRLEQVYGKPEDLIAAVKGFGVTNVEFINSSDAQFIPKALKLPFMVGRMGIIKGTK